MFGPLQVELDGQPLPRLRSRKGHWLLALLVLRHDREVERAWLAGSLWPDSSGTQALTNLRNSLLDLRRALGPQARRLRAPSLQTLALDLSDAETDLLPFDAAVARGDLPSLQGALALYRGPLLEGCAEEWVFQERQTREEAYLRALETLAGRALADGDAASAASYLRRAAVVDPLREGTQRALMQALASGGNYAAALEGYRELRLRLHQELNATRQSLCPLPPSPERPRHNLPLQLSSFVGREAQIAELKQWLAGPTRLVTLTGAGGCGKTRLALQVAAGLVEEYAEGIWLVELASLANPSLVPQAVAVALGVREEPGGSITQTLVSSLNSRPAPACRSWRQAGRRWG
jgi:DNA-binding SARP family transcriptional activator